MHHRHSCRKPQSQRGNGLIEVLVLIFIVSVGLLGMSKLQSVLVREGSQTNSRSVATSLVLAKIDDLKSFNRVVSTADTPCDTAGIFCYTEIANNAGGDMASGQRTIGNTAYNLTWQNTDWYLCNNVWGNAAPDPDDVGPGCSAVPLHKTVAVNVAWVTGRGEVGGVVQDITDNLRIERSIFANNILVNAAIGGFDGNTLPGPKVAYNPIQAPDAIPISIGGGKSTETAKPLPELSKKGESLSVLFPAVVYESNGNNGSQLVSQEEFATVSCSCKPLAADNAYGRYTPFRWVWNPTKQTSSPIGAWKSGELVTPGDRRTNTDPSTQTTNVYEVVDPDTTDLVTSWTTGTTGPTQGQGAANTTDGPGGATWRYVAKYTATVAGALEIEPGAWLTNVARGYPSDVTVAQRDNPSATTQNPLCTACCRDHHDTAGYPTYRPYIGLAANQNHSHTLAGGTYPESCRLQRIDGYWRVVPDWLLVDLTAIPCDQFNPGATGCPPTGTPDTAELETYRSRLRNLLAFFTDESEDAKGAVLPSSFSNEFNNTGIAPLIDTTDSTRNITLAQGGTKQLVARGIYADVVFEPRESGSDPRKVDSAYYDHLATLRASSSTNWDWLQFLRFYDTNLTLLAQWSPTSTSDPNPNVPGSCSVASATSPQICVTNEAIKTIPSGEVDYYDDFYSRGRLYGKQAGTGTVTVTMRTGNAGLSNSTTLDGATEANAVRTSRLAATVSGSSQAFVVQVNRKTGQVDLGKVTMSANNGVSCSPNNLETSKNQLVFNCLVSATPFSSTLTFTSQVAGVFFTQGTTTLTGNQLTVTSLTTVAVTANNP